MRLMDILRFNTPQEQDTYLQTHKGKFFSVRFASVRSTDSKEHMQPGQDYISIEIDNDIAVFVICDGVSQSFYGDFASRFLGEELLRWMREDMPTELQLGQIRTRLTDFLITTSSLAGRELEKYQVPDDAPELLREVLEEKRALGSQTTYVCGLVELPGRNFPKGRAVFSWMGDTRLRLGQGKGLGTLLTDTKGGGRRKWSSLKGPVGGEPELFVKELLSKGKRRFDRVVAYTDGLPALDKLKTKPGNKELSNLIEESINSSTSDDSSYLEIEIN